jgi:hypothetical protein
MVCPVRLSQIGSPDLGPCIVRFVLFVIVHNRILISTGRIASHQQRTLVIQMETDCWSGQPIPTSQVQRRKGRLCQDAYHGKERGEAQNYWWYVAERLIRAF